MGVFATLERSILSSHEESAPHNTLILLGHFCSDLPRISIQASAVLQAEASLVSLCHLEPCGFVQEIVVDERLKGVEVVVAGVPKPQRWVEDGKKIGSAQIVSLTVETKQTPT